MPNRIDGRRARLLPQAPRVDRVARIERHAVGADRAVEAAVLQEFLSALVARPTQRLQLAAPESVHVAVVWVNVIGDLREHRLTAGEAEPAPGLVFELKLRTFAPAAAAVPLLQLGAVWHVGALSRAVAVAATCVAFLVRSRLRAWCASALRFAPARGRSRPQGAWPLAPISQCEV